MVETKNKEEETKLEEKYTEKKEEIEKKYEEDLKNTNADKAYDFLKERANKNEN
jgi:hypothetical protein